ncbi:MAG: hypothetical protein ACRC7N_04660, partial [Clostridium sp.]
ISNKKIENINNLKSLVRNLVNRDSYSSIFDSDYLMHNEKVQFLIRISNMDIYREKLVDRLFNSKVYFMKKLALYIVVKNNMIDYLTKKINDNDFDFEFMIRNNEFNGEIRECFKLINDYADKSIISEKNLINMISSGLFFEYKGINDDYKDGWLYKRFRELTAFEGINKEYEILKNKVKYDYELEPVIGAVEGGIVETIPLMDSKKANEMNMTDWIGFMNSYHKKDHKEFLKEYHIKEDVKIFIECFKRNIDSYIESLELLIEVKNYEWIYYIFTELIEVLNSVNNDFQKYYGIMLDFISNYIDRLGNIYEEPLSDSIDKKHLVGKICSILIIILNKINIESDEFKDIYKI